jgi:hypothetical protein
MVAASLIITGIWGGWFSILVGRGVRRLNDPYPECRSRRANVNSSLFLKLTLYTF